MRLRQMTTSNVWRTSQSGRSTHRDTSTVWIGYVLIYLFLQAAHQQQSPSANRHPGAWVRNLPQKSPSPAKDLRNLWTPPNFTPHFGAAKLSNCRSNETPVRLRW